MNSESFVGAGFVCSLRSYWQNMDLMNHVRGASRRDIGTKNAKEGMRKKDIFNLGRE